MFGAAVLEDASGSGAGASAAQVDGEDDNDSDSDAGDDANANKERNAGAAKDAAARAGAEDAKAGDKGEQDKAVLLPGMKAKAVVVDIGDAGGEQQPLWRRTLRALSPANLFGGGSGGGGVDVGKRKLTRDNRDTLVLTLPFLVWGAVVVAIYTFSYLTLKAVSEPLVNLDVANRVKTKINRCVFTAQEVISQTDDAARRKWQQELLVRQADLEMFYDALLYGSSNLPGGVDDDDEVAVVASRRSMDGKAGRSSGVRRSVDMPRAGAEPGGAGKKGARDDDDTGSVASSMD
ncbi:hypothetical protein TSOC_009266 [Tetrabaena socialis]|uniref:Uncharacterized protein n=1 Tax=Tetrabaena socialis TaxID=47790 RepID=A0A2J7ZWD6_9CHLO|nr:hypothetical protein TSOC_009266 [Tetrabaena socialis]|eukprot:PNH04565.1 hypothetical protein TSOC_009266 [Tetrabaena socialis]